MRRAIGTIAVLVCGSALWAGAAETLSGRYVHVTIPGPKQTLSLAEVQVFSGGENVALKRPAVQTTTSHGGLAARAVDGKTDGNWKNGSVTHTSIDQPDPAWEVDLGGSRPIEKIVVWNRVSRNERLHGVRVSVLDAKRKVVWGTALAKPGPTTELVVASTANCAWAGQKIAKIVPGKAEVSRGTQKTRTRKPKARKPKARGAALSTMEPTPMGTPESLRLAVEDLIETFGAEYPNGPAYLKRLAAVEKQLAAGAEGAKAAFDALQKEALLANPLLAFGKLLVVKRAGDAGLPANWLGNCSLPRGRYDNEIAVLSPISPDGKLTTLHKPDGREYVGDVDLHWDADRLLFSTIGTNDRWQIFELKLDASGGGLRGAGVRQVSQGDAPDVDNYDGCYVPGGRIVYCSTAPYHAVPCIGGKQPVGNLYSMNADGSGVRQLCFEQDHDWYPTMLPNGRVMYTRWEYSDTPHYFTRIVMTMYPDGSNQQAHYGTNSYWPNSLFYARPLPGQSSRFVGIVSGHHGDKRIGELVVFDPSKGQRENFGVVRRIPGRGRPVPAVIQDRLVASSWPKFLHPWPLGDPATGRGVGKYFLVSCKLAQRSANWGIWLADAFDNLLPICVRKDAMVFEPVPFQKHARPASVAPRVDPKRKDALVFMVDVYRGPGLRDVPRGTVKKLRLFSYHFAYNRSGGHSSVGAESGWDIKRILGTVPVEADGSAFFRIPANAPIAVQPLDEKGRALQLMRSWFVGMPGETISCIGCHEPMRDAPPPVISAALKREASEITPWLGPPRPVSFLTDVRPVLDKYCVGCHDGSKKGRPNFSPGKTDRYTSDTAYMALHPYVRRPGPESDNYVLAPMEYHVATSELFQMLAKGHHNVRLDDEALERLACWVDLNVPHRGQWNPAEHAGFEQARRRRELAKQYANVECDPEREFGRALAQAAERKVRPVMPKPAVRPPARVPDVPNWQFDAAEAARRRKAAGARTAIAVDLGNGARMDLVLVPAGTFVMGSADGCLDEAPPTAVRIDEPFWMGVCEVSNRQFAAFDAGHDSRFIDQQWKDHTTPGYPANLPDQPVIRVSWRQAAAFCRWLSARAGRPFALPTEAQWEWACRAGSGAAMSFGGADADFARFANLGDARLLLFAVRGVNPKPVKNPSPDMAFLPRIGGVDDGQMIVAPVGGYQANAWGLKDMHGNVAEWTRSVMRAYPYADADGRNDPDAPGKRVVRGGSWRDRPHRATSSFRLAYPPYQRVFNVGFRVVCPARPAELAAK